MKPILQLLPNLLRLIIALLLLLLLPLTDATTMPDNSDDDTVFPSKAWAWANDTSGVSLLENLEDANLSDKVTGAKSLQLHLSLPRH